MQHAAERGCHTLADALAEVNEAVWDTPGAHTKASRAAKARTYSATPLVDELKEREEAREERAVDHVVSRPVLADLLTQLGRLIALGIG